LIADVRFSRFNSSARDGRTDGQTEMSQQYRAERADIQEAPLSQRDRATCCRLKCGKCWTILRKIVF